MSWTKCVTLWCDGEGCREYRPFSTNQVRAARESAKQGEGWAYRDGEDLCPDCKEDGFQ